MNKLNLFFNALNFFQLRGLREDLRALRGPAPMPTQTPMCEEYITIGQIQGPPPARALSAGEYCTKFDPEALEEYKAQLAISALEKRFNS